MPRSDSNLATLLQCARAGLCSVEDGDGGGQQQRGHQVSCDWSTRGHVTTMITSDWSAAARPRPPTPTSATCRTGSTGWRGSDQPPDTRSVLELQTKVREDFTITEKHSAKIIFDFKNLCGPTHTLKPLLPVCLA